MTIVNKYIFKTRGRDSCLYACFVDFKAAFDSVWRDALLMKLYNYGVGGSFLKLVKDLHVDVYYCLKINGGLANAFRSAIGVKQGCVLSPLFFKIFIADLSDIFDEDCHPVLLNSTKLNCLSYADDLVLLSESKEGLQRCIDKLNAYLLQKNGILPSIS